MTEHFCEHFERLSSPFLPQSALIPSHRAKLLSSSQGSKRHFFSIIARERKLAQSEAVFPDFLNDCVLVGGYIIFNLAMHSFTSCSSRWLSHSANWSAPRMLDTIERRQSGRRRSLGLARNSSCIFKGARRSFRDVRGSVQPGNASLRSRASHTQREATGSTCCNAQYM
jgi:hypothetical protein